MKLEKLVGKVKKELKNEQEEVALGIIKNSLRTIKLAEKTLKVAKKKHDKLLKTDVDDIEVEDFVY